VCETYDDAIEARVNNVKAAAAEKEEEEGPRLIWQRKQNVRDPRQSVKGEEKKSEAFFVGLPFFPLEKVVAVLP